MISRMYRPLRVPTASMLGACLLMTLTGCGVRPTPGPPISESEMKADLASGQLVLVKFGAQWCGPCKEVDKELAKLAERDQDLKIINVDIDSNQALAEEYNVSGIPHMLLIRNSQVLDQQLGYLSLDELSEWVRSHDSAPSTTDST